MVGYVFDRVCETSTSTGTGNILLDGALTGYRSFSIVLSSGQTCYYLIEGVSGSGSPTGDWEVGIGYYVPTATFVRSVVLSSSNAGAYVDLAAGTKRVHITAPAAQLGLQGVLCKKAANLTAQNLTTDTVVTWDTELFDTGGFHSTSATTSRITMPSTDVTPMYVELTGQIGLLNATATDWLQATIRVDGSSSIFYVGRQIVYSNSTSPVVQVQTPIILAQAADYFELSVQVATDTSVDINASLSWLQLRVVQ
jgi:hypothetical protein